MRLRVEEPPHLAGDADAAGLPPSPPQVWGRQVPHWRRPPQPSPGAAVDAMAQVVGVQRRPAAALAGLPPPPQVWGGQVPHWRTPPQPSPAGPQLKPSAAQVVGVHVGRAARAGHAAAAAGLRRRCRCRSELAAAAVAGRAAVDALRRAGDAGAGGGGVRARRTCRAPSRTTAGVLRGHARRRRAALVGAGPHRARGRRCCGRGDTGRLAALAGLAAAAAGSARGAVAALEEVAAAVAGRAALDALRRAGRRGARRAAALAGRAAAAAGLGRGAGAALEAALPQPSPAGPQLDALRAQVSACTWRGGRDQRGDARGQVEEHELEELLLRVSSRAERGALGRVVAASVPASSTWKSPKSTRPHWLAAGAPTGVLNV